MSDQPPKLHVDSDWKKQAAAEKEKLAREVEQASSAGGPGRRVGPEGLPEPSFAEIVATFATQVLMFLGDVPNPVTGRPTVNLPLAKHYIDLLAILEGKTAGNLDDGERDQLNSLLYETRMRYVQMASGGAGLLGDPIGDEGEPVA